MAAKKDLKATLEKQISDMLAAEGEPSEGRMKLIALGIKMCALNAKLEENEYGDFFNAGDTGGVPPEPGQKPAARRRANGGTDA